MDKFKEKHLMITLDVAIKKFPYSMWDLEVFIKTFNEVNSEGMTVEIKTVKEL